MTWGTQGAAVSEALVKDWVRESLLQRSPSQQEPCKSMFVQGLVVPLMVQEGRWQVRTHCSFCCVLLEYLLCGKPHAML